MEREKPLMLAVKEQNSTALEWLLNEGADLNIPNKDHETPLHVTLSARNPKDYLVPLFLLYHGAGLYAKDILRQTAMDILFRNVCVHGGDDTLGFAKLVLKIIALKYRIRDCLSRKLEQIPDLYNYFYECLKEVRLMREHIVCDNTTSHDACLDCFQTRFGDHVQKNNMPVIEILASGVFKKYYYTILDVLPDPD